MDVTLYGSMEDVIEQLISKTVQHRTHLLGLIAIEYDNVTWKSPVPLHLDLLKSGSGGKVESLRGGVRISIKKGRNTCWRRFEQLRLRRRPVFKPLYPDLSSKELDILMTTSTRTQVLEHHRG